MLATLSMSRAFNAEKGRAIRVKQTIGFSTPLTRTIKFPFPGFSLLTSTMAKFPTALTIAFVLVLKADHCLHASTSTFISDSSSLPGPS